MLTNNGRPQLHASSLGVNCMEQFRRRYIEGEKIPPGIALIVGTGTHKSIDENLTHKINTGKLLPFDAARDAARDGVNIAWDAQEIKLTPDEAAQGVKAIRGQAIDKAVRLASVHYVAKAPVINPIAVERSWSLEIPGIQFDLVGRLDIQERDAIRDSKTTGKTPDADVAVKSVQLKAYALAVKVIDGAQPSKVVLDYLIDTKTPKAMSFEHKPDAEDFQVVLARADVLARAMQAGIFVPVDPGHWCCCEKWCGYWQTCRYATHPKQFSIS